jgi:hypothetical protein
MLATLIHGEQVSSMPTIDAPGHAMSLEINRDIASFFNVAWDC